MRALDDSSYLQAGNCAVEHIASQDLTSDLGVCGKWYVESLNVLVRRIPTRVYKD